MPDRIDDLNRKVLLSTDSSGTILLFYDRFEKRIYVEDKNESLNYLSDGTTFKPATLPDAVSVVYCAASNGVLSIKFSHPIDRRSLLGIQVRDISGLTTSAKIVDFLEDDTLVLMAYYNADTMIIDGNVTDKTKNLIEFSTIAALPIVYKLFDSREELAKYWKMNIKKYTSTADDIDITEKEFEYDYNTGTTTDGSPDWLTDEWKTFYYDATTGKSFNDNQASSIGTEMVDKFALCYVREIPTNFKGEVEGPNWFVTQFYNDEDRGVQITGWIPDIISYFDIDELQDFYLAVSKYFITLEEALKLTNEEIKFDSYIYNKGTIWYAGDQRDIIKDGFLIVGTEPDSEKTQTQLILSFSKGQIVDIIDISKQDYLDVDNSVRFEKVDYGTEQDVISAGVILTRGVQHGLYNAVNESSYLNTSPENTGWNSNYSYLTKTEGDTELSGWGWSDLSNITRRRYTTFSEALGGAVGDNILSTELVMLDKTTGFYWKFEFHSWTKGGSGGGFSYTRTRIKTPQQLKRG